LQKHVFPRLREYCQKHGARFQAIDLRWGPPGYESDCCENCNSRSHPDLRVSRFPAET
jgi:hypothetical protein